MTITSAFQADDAGSIPAGRSSKNFPVYDDESPGVTGKLSIWNGRCFLQNCCVKILASGFSAHPKTPRVLIHFCEGVVPVYLFNYKYISKSEK